METMLQMDLFKKLFINYLMWYHLVMLSFC
jgi:hypothetical protein